MPVAAVPAGSISRAPASKSNRATNGRRCITKRGACSASSSGTRRCRASTGISCAIATRSCFRSCARARNSPTSCGRCSANSVRRTPTKSAGDHRKPPQYRRGFLGADLAWNGDGLPDRKTLPRRLMESRDRLAARRARHARARRRRARRHRRPRAERRVYARRIARQCRRTRHLVDGPLRKTAPARRRARAARRTDAALSRVGRRQSRVRSRPNGRYGRLPAHPRHGTVGFLGVPPRLSVGVRTRRA